MPHLLPHERALIARLRTPRQVQRWLDSLPYNKGNVGKTLRSFRGVLSHKTAHCIEGALAAAFILQHHGYPPLLLDLSSSDGLDHVCFLFHARRMKDDGRSMTGEGRRAGEEGARARGRALEPSFDPRPVDPSPSSLVHRPSSFRGGWGTVSQSRYPGLRGRAPAFRSVRDLAWSYCEPFVDATGAVRGYATFDLRALGGMDWALDHGNVWRIERALFENRHTPLRLSPSRERALRERYLAWKRASRDKDAQPPRDFYSDPRRYW